MEISESFEDSDDDDLIAPNLFKKPANFQVLTPRKAIQPVNDVLSPLSSLNQHVNKAVRGGKAKVSLCTLLTEKKRDDAIQSNVSDMLELEMKFQDDEYMDMADDSLDLSQIALSQEVESSQDLTQDYIEDNQDEKENLFQISERFVNDFPDTFPGEKYFIHPNQADALRPIIKELLTFAMDSEDFFSDADLDGEDENELLYTTLISFLPTNENLPRNVCACLWKLLSFCLDYRVSSTVLHILGKYLLDVKLDCHWVPSAQDFIDALENFGADLTALLPDCFSQFRVNCKDSTINDDDDFFLSPKSIRKCFPEKVPNLKSIIALMTISVQSCSTKYTIQELNCLLIIAMKLSVEKIVQNILWHIKVFIGSLLDAYKSEKWKEEMRSIWTTLYSMKMHHRNLLQLVESIPPSKVGGELQLVLAFNIASSIIMQDRSYLDSPAKITELHEVISSITVSDHTDYFELFSALSLIRLSINIENIPAGQKSNLIRLQDELSLLHGKIKECKGAYLDRTKVKDVILGMVSELKFSAQNLQTQSQLESYFGVTDKKQPGDDSQDFGSQDFNTQGIGSQIT